jgi:hypothetical protein
MLDMFIWHLNFILNTYLDCLIIRTNINHCLCIADAKVLACMNVKSYSYWFQRINGIGIEYSLCLVVIVKYVQVTFKSSIEHIFTSMN